MKNLFCSGVILMVALAACQQKEEPKPQYQFPTGPAGNIQSMDQEKKLREILAQDPKNVNAWISLGNMLMDASRFGEAADVYQKALDLDPKNVDVRVDMGTCFRYAGKPDSAIQEYRKALEINPQHLQALKNMGIVQAYDLRNTQEAVKAFEKALAIAPNAPDADRLRQEIQRLQAAK